MNEILATLYYCLHETSEDFGAYFESELFYSFEKVMEDLKNGFIRAMDNTDSGINGKIKKFADMFY